MGQKSTRLTGNSLQRHHFGIHSDCFLQLPHPTEGGLDLHPPRIFQIDGNMGGTAAVCEMLMQSRRGEIYLLPAIPPEWKSGSVKNFCAQDGLKVSFEWQDEKITSLTLVSVEDQNIKVIFGDNEIEISLIGGKKKTLNF